MENERNRIIDLVASYFANWQYSRAVHDIEDEHDYICKYEGAQKTAELLGITEQEIKEYAWSKWGNEIGKAFNENNQTI